MSDHEVDSIRALLGLQGRKEGARDYIEVLEKKIQRQRNWARYLETRNGPELVRIKALEEKARKMEVLLARCAVALGDDALSLEVHDILFPLPTKTP